MVQSLRYSLVCDNEQMFTLGIFINQAKPSLKKKDNRNYLIVSLLLKDNAEVVIFPHTSLENTVQHCTWKHNRIVTLYYFSLLKIIPSFVP